MKVNISVDLTPAEARELMGFEGAAQMQQLFIKAMTGQMDDESDHFSQWFSKMMKQNQELMKTMAPNLMASKASKED